MKTKVQGIIRPLTKWMVLSVSVLALTGCLDEVGTNQDATYDVEAIVQNKNMSPAEKSEALSRVAEALMIPSGFMYADEVLKLALKYDGKNLRAQLYSRINAPFMALKGVVKRVEPLATGTEDGRRSYQETVESLKVNSAIYEFFMSGKPDIRNEAQAQAFVDTIVKAQNNLRLFFKANKQISLDLNPRQTGKASLVWEQCPVEASGKKAGYHAQYTVKGCGLIKPTSFTLTAGDVEVLQHMVAGMQIYTSLYNAYEYTGILELSKSSKDREYTPKESIELVRKHAKLGRYRQSSGFHTIHSLASDAYAGIQWVERYQRELCPRGGITEGQRRGMLFEDGICFQPDETAQPPYSVVMGVVNKILLGQAVNVLVSRDQIQIEDLATDKSNVVYRTHAKFISPIARPVADLKTLLPTRFDRCGNAINLGDNTIGGLLPSADGQTVAGIMGAFDLTCP